MQSRVARARPTPPRAHLRPWHRCTPALPKPAPAKLAARVMAALASSSDRSCGGARGLERSEHPTHAALGLARTFTARLKYLAMSLSACMLQTSDTGFAPWYAGRREGDAAGAGADIDGRFV